MVGLANNYRQVRVQESLRDERTVSRRDELYVGKLLGKEIPNVALPARMQMQIYLVNQDDCRLIKGLRAVGIMRE